MTRTLLLTLSLCLCVDLSTATPALAQPAEAPLSDAKELARADELYKQANAAFDAKDYTQARKLYLEAYGIKKTYDIAGHLGLTEMELGLYRDAAEHLAAALRGAPPHQGKKPFEAVIAELEKAKREVGTVTIKAPAGAALTVDGKPIGSAPLAHEVFVEPGARTFAGETQTEIGSEAREISKGDAFTLELKLTAKPKGIDPIKPEVEPRPSWPGWLLGGVGLAAAGVGAGLIGGGQMRIGDAEDIGAEIREAGGECEPASGPGSDRCADGIDEIDAGNAITDAGIAVLAIGSAALVGGVIYLLLLPDDSSEATLSFAPFVGHDMAGVLVQGAF